MKAKLFLQKMLIFLVVLSSSTWYFQPDHQALVNYFSVTPKSVTAAGRNYLNINLDEVYLSGSAGDPDGQGEMQLLIVATDGRNRSSTLYCPSPPKTIAIRRGDRIKPKCFSIGFVQDEVQSPVMLTFIAIDIDDGGTPADIGTQLASSALTVALAIAAPPASGIAILGMAVFDAILSYLPTAIKDWIEKQEILGEQSISIDARGSWSTNNTREIVSNNKAVTFRISIDLTSTAPAQVVSTVPNKGTTQNPSNQPPAAAPQVPKNSNPAVGGKWIAFTSTRNGDKDIFIMRPDSEEIRRVTNWPGDERTPTWSPDGRRIAFYSIKDGDQEIYIIDLDSGKIIQVTKNRCGDFGPAWSPDGQRIAFYSDCDGNREIYTINPNGSGREQLTFTNKVYNWFPTWSPDSRTITYSSNLSGSYYIYKINVDGSGNNPIAKGGCIPSFSPDGKKIVFASYCTDEGDIYVMKADGSNARPITNDGRNRNPTWSSDGNWIVYQSTETGYSKIWIMDPNGGNRQMLTDGVAYDAEPIWQP